MAQVTNFKDRLADYAGSLAETDDDALQQYVLDCCLEVIKTVQQQNPDSVYSFTAQSGTIADGNPVSLLDENTIIGVVRNEVQATRGNASTSIYYNDSDSIYYASSRDPKYWIKNGNLFIAPEPTGPESAYYYYIPKYSVKNFDSGVTEIVDVDSDNKVFPEKYYEALLICISIKILNRRLNDYLENDEDIELVNGIQSQIARFDQEYQKIMGIEPQS
jgi:hypothetical protein|tara:strand:- start:477 stop:1130 length:654 start_codon:yes stop_codon:yes gene_type:complete